MANFGRKSTSEMPAAKPAEKTDLTANQILIKRLVETACGDAAHYVQLKPAGNNRLVITLCVRNAIEGQRLGERILVMPELEPYKVDLEMEVKP